ncbi:hypothetical protein MBLNU459_g2512t1 [Dothideomycetes sp. NU459]
MGVKNLAFCLLDVHESSWQPASDQGRNTSPNSSPLRLLEWKRLDMSGRLMHTLRERHDETTAYSDDRGSSAAQPVDEHAETPLEGHANMYTPATLSKVAYSLASEFVKYKPDKILIERQRFRSGGAPAIQEWTVRVNMLESMLWAALETMRHAQNGIYDHDSSINRDSSSSSGGGGGVAVDRSEQRSFPDVLEMNPRRIGLFWLAQGRNSSILPAGLDSVLEKRPALPVACDNDNNSGVSGDGATKTPPPPPPRVFEKKDKIALARHWLGADGGDLAHAAHLSSLVSSFLSPKSGSVSSKTATKRSGRHRTKRSGVEAESPSDAQTESLVRPVSAALCGSDELTAAPAKLGKLDDLADCLVQGVTQALWEENRRRILRYSLDSDRV